MDGFKNWLNKINMDEGKIDDDDNVIIIMKENEMKYL